MERYLLDSRDIQPIITSAVTSAITSAVSVGDSRFVNISGDTMTGELKTPSVSASYLQVDRNADVNVTVGQIAWNMREQTFDMGLENGSVLQVGQEFLILVHNETGSDIPNGRVVYITSGSDNGIMHIAIASSTDDSAFSTIAVTTQPVLNGGTGLVTKIGKVRDINTSDIPPGKIYLGHAGLFTSTEPLYPEHSVEVGYCVVQHATSGVIFVDIDKQFAIEDLYNVTITNPQSGDSLIYENNQWINRNFGAITKEATGFSSPENVTVTYDSLNRTITLGGKVEAYWRSNSVPNLSAGWTSPAHSAGTSGLLYLYYDGQDFVWSSTPWTYDMLQIAVVNYDHNGAYRMSIREVHGTMPWQAHREFHQVIGTYLAAGGDLSNYALNSTTTSARRPYISQTTVADEDLWTVNNQLATNSYTLFSLSGSMYRAIRTAQTDIVRLNGSQPYYNNFNGTNWVETLFGSNEYGCIFLIAVPAAADSQSQLMRYAFVQPQATYSTLAAAQAVTSNQINFGDSTSILPEFVFIDKIIIRYTGGDWQLIQVDKLTGTQRSQSSITGSGLTSVTHDSTLSGAGTAISPLSVTLALDGLTDVAATSPTNGNGLVYVSATNTWEKYGNMYAYDDVAIKFYQKEGKWDSTTTTVSANSATWGSGGASDGKVKVTSGDTADYLGTKLIEGTGMTISTTTSSVTFTVDPPQDALQTMPISMATGQGGSFDGSYSHITALYVPYNTTVDKMACYVTQTGSSNIYLAIYDSSYNLVCQTSSFAPSAIGIVSAPLLSSCSLTKNNRYYFYVGGNANGCQLLLASGLYVSNEPFLAKEDQNQASPPTTFSGGSSDSKRFWIIAYKS